MNDGGPAFPSHGTMGEVAHEGMSLRDYFAATISAKDVIRIDYGPSQKELFGEEFSEDWPIVRQIEFNMKLEAYLRYKYADAMLAARDSKTQSEQS